MRDRFQILAQVERVSGSHALRESESLRKLLNYLTHQALDHPGEPIKEYQIATEVLGRRSDFDPQFNSMVRVQAGRLRSKLTEYYSDEGSDDPIVVDFPKGTYALHFRERKSALPKSPGTEEHGSNGHALSSVAPTRTASLWNALTIGLLIALFACLSCLGYLLTRKPIDAPSSSAEKLPESVEIFWQGFLTEPEEPWVIFSNAEFVGRPETGMRYYVEGKDSKEAVRDHPRTASRRCFEQVGKAFVIRPIELGRQNDEDVIVTGGLKEGDVVTLENPAESAKRAKKKL